MISICIPTYNFNVIPLVDELLLQSADPGCEIILIDDASESEYIEFNKALGDRVRTIFLERNVGRAKIRNLFLNYAEFDHLLFLDCDSLVQNSDFIANYVNAIQNGKEKVVCGGRVYPESPPSSEHMLRWRYGVESESKPAHFRSLHPYRSFMTNNFMIQRGTLERIRFDESLTSYGHEDTLFGYDLKNNGIPVVHIENPVLNGHLETNAEYIDKTRDGIYNLIQILKRSKDPEQFTKEVRLLRYYSEAKEKRRVKRLKFIYSVFKKNILRRMLKGTATIKQFNFHKLMLLIDQIEGDQNLNSSA